MTERRYRDEFIDRRSLQSRYTERTADETTESIEQSKLSRNRKQWLKMMRIKLNKIGDVLARDLDLGILTPDHADGQTVYFTPAKIINWAISKDFEVAGELRSFAEQQPETVASICTSADQEKQLTKLEKQQQAILATIRTKGFNPMEIPDGEKGTIELICKNDYPLLFNGETSFNNAWKNSRSLIRMANHASYTKRGCD